MRVRALCVLFGVFGVLAVAPARADVVSPCPPGFSPSHSGCRFDPGPSDLGLCGACACTFVVLGLAGAAFAYRAGRARGPREG